MKILFPLFFLIGIFSSSSVFACEGQKASLAENKDQIGDFTKKMPQFQEHDLTGKVAQYMSAIILSEEPKPVPVDMILEADDGNAGVLRLFKDGCAVSGWAVVDATAWNHVLNEYLQHNM